VKRIALGAAAVATFLLAGCGESEALRATPRQDTPTRSEPSPFDAFPAATRFAREGLGWPTTDPEACFVDAGCLETGGDRETVYVYRSLPCPADGTPACEVAVVHLERTLSGKWQVTRCVFFPNAPFRRGAKRCEQEGPFVPERVTNEHALRLIRSCQVLELITLHGGELQLTLKSGRIVFVGRPDDVALIRAGVEAQGRGCEIALGME
jgi:hypothetical protein